MSERQWPTIPEDEEARAMLEAAGLTEADVQASVGTPEVILQAAAETFARRLIRMKTSKPIKQLKKEEGSDGDDLQTEGK